MATKKKSITSEPGSIAESNATPLPSAEQGITNGMDLNELLETMDGTAENPDDGHGEDTDNTSPDQDVVQKPETKETDISPEAPAAAKPKRTVKKKAPVSEPEAEPIIPKEAARVAKPTEKPDISDPSAPQPAKKPTRRRSRASAVLTIDSRAEIETQENREDIIWHEIQNAHRTRKILTGTLGGIEQTDTGKSVAIVSYKDMRIIIPAKEMMIILTRSPSGPEYDDLMLRQNKILGNMLGAEIDFIVKGVDSKTHTAVASRKDAMLKKRQLFYLNEDASGQARVHQGRVVQARVIAVAAKVVRVEVFGVECSIMARDLSWDWLGDAHERFNVGDEILVRILSVTGDTPEEISIKADVKSVTEDTSQENLKKCRVQSKYVGTVTDVFKGVIFVRLSNGANAIAHSCYDRRMPGKKDEVGFAVTRIDAERGIAVGIITRIIKQNL